MAEKKVQQNHCLKLIAILWNKPGFWIHLPGGLGSHAGPGFWILVVSSFQYSHDLFWQLSLSWLSLHAGRGAGPAFLERGASLAFGSLNVSFFRGANLWLTVSLIILCCWCWAISKAALPSGNIRQAGFEEADGTFGPFASHCDDLLFCVIFAWNPMALCAMGDVK